MLATRSNPARPSMRFTETSRQKLIRACKDSNQRILFEKNICKEIDDICSGGGGRAFENRQQLSLLEKANFYRAHYPIRWEARQAEKQRLHNESVGIYEKIPILEEYQVQQMKIVAEKRKQQQIKDNEPRTIVVEIKFGVSNQPEPKQSAVVPSPCATDDDERLSSVYYKNNKKNSKSRSELVVSVVKGKSLFNHLNANESLSERCSVQVALCPDGEKRPMMSQQRYITPQGSTRWSHRFYFRGFDSAEFRDKYIKIVIFGHSSARRVFIGQVIIAGHGALIQTKDQQPRGPTMNEVLPLVQAIDRPETTVKTKLTLVHKDWQRKNAMSAMIATQAAFLPVHKQSNRKSDLVTRRREIMDNSDPVKSGKETGGEKRSNVVVPGKVIADTLSHSLETTTPTQPRENPVEDVPANDNDADKKKRFDDHSGDEKISLRSSSLHSLESIGEPFKANEELSDISSKSPSKKRSTLMSLITPRQRRKLKK